MKRVNIPSMMVADGKAFVGISNKFYVQNPFGIGKMYEFRIFHSVDDYTSVPNHHMTCSKEEMLFDMETTEYFEFIVNINGKPELFKTDLFGQIIGIEEQMEDRLDSIYKEKGRENVRFTYSKKKSIGSLEQLIY